MCGTRRTQRAAILIQVVMMMGVLLGFTALTTDYGLLVLRQRALQNGVDAAALAGGPELASADTGFPAELHAKNNATANRILNVSVDTKTGPHVLPREITVTASEDVRTFFIRVLDPRKRTGKARASATVAVMPVSTAWRVRPWGVPYEFFNPDQKKGSVKFGEPATLAITVMGNEKPYDQGDNQTFVYPLVLGAPDPADSTTFENYKRNCMGGYDQSISLADYGAIGQPGNLDYIVAATSEAVKNSPQSIMAQAGSAAYRDSAWDNPGKSPRVVFLPVIRNIVLGQADIIAFAAFYIEGMEDNRITGRFIHYTLPYEEANPSALKPDSYNYGLYSVRLIK